MNSYLFTSESVSHGHPDKICDQISDGLLDFFLKQDPYARTAIEALATKDKLIIAGEINSHVLFNAKDIEAVARSLLKEIGCTQPGFSWDTLEIEVRLQQQSPDISRGVENNGAGDQGMMFGYACSEAPNYMPASIYYSHLILRNIFAFLSERQITSLGPDAKSQVTIKYEKGKPIGIERVVLSIQHQENTNREEIMELLHPVIVDSLPFDCPREKVLLNPTGMFVLGGPAVDTGLTGRKIIVDTYGGAAPHGGGAFSGKDSTKVDRSAAYAARYLAKNIVMSGLAESCLIQLSYAIGVADPVSIYLDTKGTSRIPDHLLVRDLEKLMDLSPRGIAEKLGLYRPIFRKTATYGHFGRVPEQDGSFSWEKGDLVQDILGRF